MKKKLSLLFIYVFISFITLAQTQSFSIKIGGDYWQTKLQTEQPLVQNSIGGHSSIYGYRLGVSYQRSIYRKFSLLSDLGYSQGGFAYDKSLPLKLNQIYISFTPQFSLNKHLKIHVGGILHYNFRKDSLLSYNIEPINWGICGGASFVLDRFELGFRYIQYLNYYYDYRKIYSFAVDEKQYWSVKGLFMSYRFFGKNSNKI